jgi:hypothetical protein
MTRGRRGPHTGFCAAILLLAAPARLWAEPAPAGAVGKEEAPARPVEERRDPMLVPPSAPGLRVVVNGCGGLRTARVEELLRLELATLVPTIVELPPLEVQFVCTGTRVDVTLADSITGKWVAREVALPPAPQADGERTLALAASELFLASWLEILIQKPEERTPARDPQVMVAAERAAERALPPRGPRITMDLLATARARHLSEPIRTLGVALRIGPAKSESWQWFAGAGWEAGASQRDAGRAELNAGSAGLGVRWRWAGRNVELGAIASVSALYLTLRGVPSSSAFYGATHGGVAGELGAGGFVLARIGALRLGAEISAGALSPGPIGRVDAEGRVTAGGLWAGAALIAGFSL